MRLRRRQVAAFRYFHPAQRLLRNETNMTTDRMKSAASDYHAAQAAQYTAKDLRAAIESYNRIIVAHPDAPEADYSRTQIRNIASRIVEKDVLLGAHSTLALATLPDSPVHDDA